MPPLGRPWKFFTGDYIKRCVFCHFPAKTAKLNNVWLSSFIPIQYAIKITMWDCIWYDAPTSPSTFENRPSTWSTVIPPAFREKVWWTWSRNRGDLKVKLYPLKVFFSGKPYFSPLGGFCANVTLRVCSVRLCRVYTIKQTSSKCIQNTRAWRVL